LDDLNCGKIGAFGKARVDNTMSYHSLYLMMRYNEGNKKLFRIGVTNNLKRRVLNEFADKLWILSDYNSRQEALMNESLVAAEFGIPQTRFTSRRSHEDLYMLIKFWSNIGDNSIRGLSVLEYFDRNLDKPFWENRRAL
jgi:hypothetical protein